MKSKRQRLIHDLVITVRVHLQKHNQDDWKFVACEIMDGQRWLGEAYDSLGYDDDDGNKSRRFWSELDRKIHEKL